MDDACGLRMLYESSRRRRDYKCWIRRNINTGITRVKHEEYEWEINRRARREETE